MPTRGCICNRNRLPLIFIISIIMKFVNGVGYGQRQLRTGNCNRCKIAARKAEDQHAWARALDDDDDDDVPRPAWLCCLSSLPAPRHRHVHLNLQLLEGQLDLVDWYWGRHWEWICDCHVRKLHSTRRELRTFGPKPLPPPSLSLFSSYSPLPTYIEYS